MDVSFFWKLVSPVRFTVLRNLVSCPVMCFMFAKNPRFLKCHFESQCSQMGGTDHIHLAVHGKLGLLFQNLIIAQLVKNISPTSSGKMVHFYTRSQSCPKQLLASSCPSFRMEQPGSHWTRLSVRIYVHWLTCCFRRNWRLVPMSQMNSVHIITPWLRISGDTLAPFHETTRNQNEWKRTLKISL